MSTTSRSEIPDLGRVQRTRKRILLAVTSLLAAALPFVASIRHPEGALHETIEAIGFALIIVCVLGRTWATLYIGGRKKHALVIDGPYSLVRNPLYLFSLIGAAGIGLTTGSATYGLAFALAVFLVFNGVIRREETYLRTNFGGVFDEYAARTARWLPGIRGWRDANELVVRPRLVLITFRDASLFLLAVPVTEAIDHLQAAGYLPVLLRLP